MFNIANHQARANKTTMRYHFTFIRMAITKEIKTKQNKYTRNNMKAGFGKKKEEEEKNTVVLGEC